MLEKVRLVLSIAVSILLDFSNYCQPFREITRGKIQYSNQQWHNRLPHYYLCHNLIEQQWLNRTTDWTARNIHLSWSEQQYSSTHFFCKEKGQIPLSCFGKLMKCFDMSDRSRRLSVKVIKVAMTVNLSVLFSATSSS